EVSLRAVRANRLALALPHPQPADELRPDDEADQQRGDRRRARAERPITDEIENARESEPIGGQGEHSIFPAATPPEPTCTTRRASPMALDPLISTASPASMTSSRRSRAAAASGTCAKSIRPSSSFASAAISGPTSSAKSTPA